MCCWGAVPDEGKNTPEEKTCLRKISFFFVLLLVCLVCCWGEVRDEGKNKQEEKTCSSLNKQDQEEKTCLSERKEEKYLVFFLLVCILCCGGEARD